MKRIEKEHIKKATVVALAIVAVGLAGLLYRQKKGTVSAVSTTPVSENQQASASGPAWTPEPGSEEEYLFSIKMDSPEADKAKHYQYATSIAKESQYLDLSTCKPSPIVLKVVNNGTITLKNDSSVSVSMVIDPDHVYTVGSKSTKAIKADFGKGEGLYGYGFSCNGTPGPRGMVFVTHE